MAISLVQQKTATGTTASATTTITSSGAGNLLVALIVTANNPGNNTFSLPAGWTQAGTTQDQNAYIGISGAVFYYLNNPGGITSVTCTINVAPTQWDMQVLEFSGVATTAALDAQNAAMNAAANATTGSVSTTTTAAGDLVIGTFFVDQTPNAGAPGTVTQPAGWTALTGVEDAAGWTGIKDAYIIQSAAGSITYTPSWTIATDYLLFIDAFKAAGSGGSVWNQKLLDTQSGVDATLKQAKKPLSDTESGRDSVLKDAQKALGDRISATDAISHVWSAHVTLSEAISALDSVQKRVLRSILNAISATDTLSESNQVLVGQNWRQTLVDAFSSTDALASWTLVKLLGDAYASTDTLSRGVMRPLYDGSSAQDALSRRVLAYLVDQGAFSDLIARQMQRTLLDATSALDRVSAGRVLLLQLLDAFSLTDVPLASYTKAQFGLLSLATTLVANALQMQITLTTTAQLAAQATLLPTPLALSVQMATALGLIPTLLASPLTMSFSIPW